jgi:hypothetical protein
MPPHKNRFKYPVTHTRSCCTNQQLTLSVPKPLHPDTSYFPAATHVCSSKCPAAAAVKENENEKEIAAETETVAAAAGPLTLLRHETSNR